MNTLTKIDELKCIERSSNFDLDEGKINMLKIYLNRREEFAKLHLSIQHKPEDIKFITSMQGINYCNEVIKDLLCIK